MGLDWICSIHTALCTDPSAQVAMVTTQASVQVLVTQYNNNNKEYETHGCRKHPPTHTHLYTSCHLRRPRNHCCSSTWAHRESQRSDTGTRGICRLVRFLEQRDPATGSIKHCTRISGSFRRLLEEVLMHLQMWVPAGVHHVTVGTGWKQLYDK